MRRHDREITDSREILSIVNECKVIRLAMLDEQGLPYIIRAAAPRPTRIL